MREDRSTSLSEKEALILRLLLKAGGQAEKYGLQLVEESEGRLARGTVYVTLGRMETKRFVCSRQEERDPWMPGIPRRLYRVTGFGERVLRAHEVAAASMESIPEFAT